MSQTERLTPLCYLKLLMYMLSHEFYDYNHVRTQILES